VVLLYLLIHAMDAYLVTPFIEQRTVSLPPALTVVVQVVLTILFGFLGLALASPITAVGLIVINEVFVRKVPARVSSKTYDAH
jgi:predicted PurR-regulated permease PerM